MSKIERKTIEIPEICRVEGHSAVTVDIEDGKVKDVQLNVFEGTRFFERIVIGHKYDEIPHITSRVCAICSTGHVLAAINAIEHIFDYKISKQEMLYRELMHLGMIIESHATHICALALPDFLETPDLLDFAVKHKGEFKIWTYLRNLGAAIQTVVGGRPFHPVNLHVGGVSRAPQVPELEPLGELLPEGQEMAIHLCRRLEGFKLPIHRTAETSYLALIPEGPGYGFFGTTVASSDGWQAHIDDYKKYLGEVVVPYSHAKKSKAKGKPFMVGSMARLFLFGERLGKTAAAIYENSSLAQGSKNTILNNLAQSIEIVEAIERAEKIIQLLKASEDAETNKDREPTKADRVAVRPGKGTGAVECPRGTLYHHYEINEAGLVTAADMITPSAQNTGRIELDIKTVAESELPKERPVTLQANLETLIRAYDPCNTCATHMVQIRYDNITH